jgi:hypothetical protein
MKGNAGQKYLEAVSHITRGSENINPYSDYKTS